MKNILIISILLVSLSANAQNWPRWRGPYSTGTAESKDAPVKFSASKGILWTAELPGKGVSTPIVWGNKIFLTCGVGADAEGKGAVDAALCYDLTGKQLWTVKFGKERPGRHKRASGSNPSPVTDGKLVFVYYKSGTLAALDLDGNVKWKTNLQDRFGKDSLQWDLGTSPVLADDNVVIAVMHEADSYVVAFNKTTGDLAWKVDRNYECSKETAQGYTTPTVLKDKGRTMIVIWGADHLTGHDAKDGSMVWECGGFNPADKPMWRVIASSTISKDGIAVVPYGRGKFLAGVKIGGKGDITETARLWEKEGIGTDSASPTVDDGKAYIVNFSATVWCIDVKTGDVVWEEALPTGKGRIYSSPTLAGDKMYFCTENGTVHICKVSGKGLELLNTAELKDNFAATPIVVDGKLILRGDKNLYCIQD
ncbi:hypothetical protein BVX97_02350 [bacterium E08(2017)]|nr:hypothetical protein BVX97_02350 [bacterium E08(2017)]